MRLMKRVMQKLRSLPGRGLLACRRRLYARRQRKGQLIEVPLPTSPSIWLYPAGQIAELLYTCRFERTELALMLRFLKPGMGVLDIGANVGLYTIVAFKTVGPGGTVIAFEPSTESYERLLSNLSLNHVTSVSVVKKALADRVYPDAMIRRDPGYRDGDRYLATRKTKNVPAAGKPEDSGDGELVPVTSLDHYLYVERASCPPIQFLKMDIEGGEYAVFRGARRFLEENPGVVIMFECTPQGCRCAGCTQEEVFELLRELGFGVYAWMSEKAGWVFDYDSVKLAGNVWACRDKRALPML
jgi:FkbM family methyltransferase